MVNLLGIFGTQFVIIIIIIIKALFKEGSTKKPRLINLWPSFITNINYMLMFKIYIILYAIYKVKDYNYKLDQCIVNDIC